MLVLALDTTTRTGSLALARDRALLETVQGDPRRTHAERLPRDILELLARHGLSVPDVELYGVAAGPGSFTGLRIGIATIQGLAFANGRPVVPVSALEALAYAEVLRDPRSSIPDPRSPTPDPRLLGVWMDAQRGEVFSALYAVERGGAESPVLRPIEDAAVDDPQRTLVRWHPLRDGVPITFVGEGALVYRTLIADSHAGEIAKTVSPAAPAIARLAVDRASAGGGVAPHAIQPVYVRRSDAELARARRLNERNPIERPIVTD